MSIVILTKGDLCITTVIPAKAGIQGRGIVHLGTPNLRTHLDHHIRVTQKFSKAAIHAYRLWPDWLYFIVLGTFNFKCQQNLIKVPGSKVFQVSLINLLR